MSRPVTTIPPDAPLHMAARIMVEQKIDSLPVVRDGVMVSIVTKADLLRCLREPLKWWLNREVLEERVARHMRANVITIGPKDSLLSAADQMRKHRIRHLPVVCQGALIGMVTDRDIRRSCGVEAIEDGRAQNAGDFYVGPTTIIEVMARHVETIAPDQTLLTAARQMSEHRFGALPVCESERLVGILTDSDLLAAVAAADS